MKQYEDELARKRYQSEHEQTRQRNAEMVRMQEEASQRQESLRRQTEESIQRSRRETDRQKAEHEREIVRAKSIAEAEGRIAENRANEDVIRRQMLARVEAETDKAMALLKEARGAVGSGFNALLADEKRGAALVAGVTAIAAGVYGAREGSRVGFRALERYLGQPSLVRETSRNVLGFRPKAASSSASASARRRRRNPPARRSRRVRRRTPPVRRKTRRLLRPRRFSATWSSSPRCPRASLSSRSRTANTRA